MAFLYINSKGQPWRKHSYSAGNTFDQCPYKYFLQKVEGYKEVDTLARYQYGKAIEETVQYHHEHNGEGTLDFFRRRWIEEQDKQLKYTKIEKDWANCMLNGLDHIRLYVIRQPSLPIPMGGQTSFQREYAKEVFVGDPNYGEIEDAGKLDIVAYVEPNHPMLPKLDWKPEYGAFRPLIIDMKAMAADLPEAYGIVAYDTQLRRYSWQSGIRDVALLGFIKKSRSLQKGSSVTLLEDRGPFKAGDEAVIALLMGDNEEQAYLVHNDFLLGEMTKAQGSKNGKTDQTNAAKDRRLVWLESNATLVDVVDITKQRLQFNAGYVTIESANDAGKIAARQIINIVNSWHQNSWPNTFGIRYPHDDRKDPYFQAFVLGDENFKKLNFIKSDEDTMDEFFDDPEDV